jgi:AcrR family transcriptional regulator
MRRLLDAGKDLANDEQPVNLRHLGIKDIADHAGVPVGTIYRYWRNADAYMEALLYEMFESNYKQTAEELNERAQTRARSGHRFSEVLRELFREDIDSFQEPMTAATLRLQMSLLADAEAPRAGHAIDDDNSLARLGQMYRERDKRWATYLARLLPLLGREPRPPLNYESLAVLVTALVEGLAMRRTADSSPFYELVDPSGETWNLLNIGLVAVLASVTNPVDSRSCRDTQRGSFWDLVQSLDIPARKEEGHPGNPSDGA